jgi:nucleotide-binding universal stress UspA family protein
MNVTDDLVMERPQAPSVKVEEPAGGMIKSILFPVHEDDGLDARLQAALSLARSCSAHLQFLQVVPLEAFTVTDSYGTALISGEIVQAVQEEADKVRARLEQQLKREDVSWNYEVTTSAVTTELLQNASVSDLIVIGREPHFREFSRTGLSLLGELICSARTPICIPGDGVQTFDPFGKALVAWNGSIEAANAVRAAIGLLKMASEVRVIRCSEQSLSLSDARLMEYLSRHGVPAQFETHAARADVASHLLACASKIGAEYLVMGGYSHSRAGEFIFGGVTRGLLRACEISLVLAH